MVTGIWHRSVQIAATRITNSGSEEHVAFNFWMPLARGKSRRLDSAPNQFEPNLALVAVLMGSPLSCAPLVRQLLIVSSFGRAWLPGDDIPSRTVHPDSTSPLGLAIDAPYGSDAGPAHTLYVAGFLNFDLAHDNGLVYALDLDTMTTEMAPRSSTRWPSTPVGTAPRCRSRISMPGPHWDRENGVVVTDSMAGEMRLTTTSLGGSRLFMASRYSNLVTAMDVEGGTVTCYGGGSDCNNPVAAPPLVIEQSAGANQLLDVFGVSNELVTQTGERDVFITHLRDQAYGSGGVTSTSAYGNNFSATGEAYVIRQNVDQPNLRLAEPVGAVGTSASVALAQDDLIYTLFTGRYGGVGNAVRMLTIPNGGLLPPDAGQTPRSISIRRTSSIST